MEVLLLDFLPEKYKEINDCIQLLVTGASLAYLASTYGDSIRHVACQLLMNSHNQIVALLTWKYDCSHIPGIHYINLNVSRIYQMVWCYHVIV